MSSLTKAALSGDLAMNPRRRPSSIDLKSSFLACSIASFLLALTISGVHLVFSANCKISASSSGCLSKVEFILRAAEFLFGSKKLVGFGI